jgi:hypothetical protein
LNEGIEAGGGWGVGKAGDEIGKVFNNLIERYLKSIY